MNRRMVRAALLVVLAGVGAVAAGGGEAAENAGVSVAPTIDLPGPGDLSFDVVFTAAAPAARILLSGLPSPLAAELACTVAAPRWSERDGAFALELGPVRPGDSCRLTTTAASLTGPVTVVAERQVAALRWHAIARVGRSEDGLAVTNVGTYRVTEVAGSAAAGPVAEPGGAVNHGSRPFILVESLDAAATKAVITKEDNVAKAIPDGPTDCSVATMAWTTNGLFWVGTAPAGAVNTSVTVHVTVTHADMSQVNIGFFYDENFPGGSGKFLWRNSPGVNLDQDFTEDIFGSAMPGVGRPVNGYYNLAATDCTAGVTGTLTSWSLRLSYDADPTVDLVADSLALSTDRVAPGASVTANWAGHVGGSGATGGDFAVNFRLSPDQVLGGGDALLAQVMVGSADAGDSFGEAARSLTVPVGTAPGDYYVLMAVDQADAIEETNEANNLVVVALAVGAPGSDVDLVAGSVSVTSASVQAGGDLVVSWTGQVAGTTDVGGPFTVGIYLSSDGIVTPSDILLARQSATWATSPGSSFGQSGQALQVPPATPAGSYTLGVLLDETGAISESAESNNTAVLYPITVSVVGLPNLVVNSCSIADSTLEPGDVVTFRWSAANTGSVATGSGFWWKVYLASNQGLTDDRQMLSSGFESSGWGAGFTYGPIQSAVTIPTDLAAGSYWIGVVVDANASVAESSETDNSCAEQITVGGGTGPGVSRWLLPAAASSPGVGTSNWKSQIAVANPTDDSREATLYFVARNQSWPGVLLSGPHAVGPKRSLYLDDPLLALSPTSGLVYVVLDAPGPVVSSRTYNLDPSLGTFGQGIPAVPFEGVAAPTELVLPMVHSASRQFRTNLGLVQAALGSYTVEVTIYAADGSPLATKSYTQTGAYRQVNDVFNDAGLGGAAVEGGWISVRLTAGSPSFWTCYASVVDALTDDPTYVAPMVPGGE